MFIINYLYEFIILNFTKLRFINEPKFYSRHGFFLFYFLLEENFFFIFIVRFTLRSRQILKSFCL